MAGSRHPGLVLPPLGCVLGLGSFCCEVGMLPIRGTLEGGHRDVGPLWRGLPKPCHTHLHKFCVHWALVPGFYS